VEMRICELVNDIFLLQMRPKFGILYEKTDRGCKIRMRDGS